MTDFSKYCSDYIDQVPYGLFIFNKQGKILEVNPEACRLFGKSREKIMTLYVSDILYKDPDPYVSLYLDRLFEDDYSKGTIKYNKNGCEECYLRIDAVKTEDNRYLAFIIDVSDEVRTDNDLKSRLSLEKIISSFSSSLTIVDLENINEVIDKALSRLGTETAADRIYFFIYSDDLVYCSDLYEWCSEGTASEIDNLQNIKSADFPWWTLKMKSNQTIMFEDINDMPDEAASEKELLQGQNIKSIVIIPSFYNGTLKGFFGFDSVQKSRKWSDEDIYLLRMAGNVMCNSIIRIKKQSERKKYNDKINSIQRLDSIGKLAGGIAHDFNNIMQIIAGYTELAMGSDGGSVKNYLQEIKNASDKASDLTAQLLAFARKQHVSPRSIDLNSAVEKTLNLIVKLIVPEINLEFKPGSVLWPVVIDPSQVAQIVTNLILNSSDSIKGKGSIILETYNTVIDEEYCLSHPYFSAGEFVVLAVSDTGCGMNDETKAHIFEPFFTTKEISGAGLGLSTVYGIVKQNEGYVLVYSEENIGSTFKVFLKKGNNTAVEDDKKEAVSEKPAVRNKSIIVVEDEDSILTLISRVLEKSDYTVVTAENGNDAVDKIEKNQLVFDLLITDVVMPGMNGNELNSRVKELYPDIKTIFMSGYTANIIADSGFLEEGINFLQKPFSVQQLKDKVAEVLEEPGD